MRAKLKLNKLEVDWWLCMKLKFKYSWARVHHVWSRSGNVFSKVKYSSYIIHTNSEVLSTCLELLYDGLENQLWGSTLFVLVAGVVYWQYSSGSTLVELSSNGATSLNSCGVRWKFKHIWHLFACNHVNCLCGVHDIHPWHWSAGKWWPWLFADE